MIGDSFEEVLPDLENLGFEVKPVRLLERFVVYAAVPEEETWIHPLVLPVTDVLDDIISFIISLLHQSSSLTISAALTQQGKTFQIMVSCLAFSCKHEVGRQ